MTPMGKKKKQEQKTKSLPTATTLIVALVSSTLFFLLGVMVGREYAIREGLVPVTEKTAESPQASTPPLPNEAAGGKTKGTEKVNITFYDQLMKSGDQELNQEIAESRKAGKPGPAQHKAAPKKHEKAKPRPEENPAQPPRQEPASGTGDYALQVAAFQNRDNALKMVRALQREGFHAHLLRGASPTHGTFYRVWVGYYKNISEASRARHALLQQKGTKITRVIIVKR